MVTCRTGGKLGPFSYCPPPGMGPTVRDMPFTMRRAVVLLAAVVVLGGCTGHTARKTTQFAGPASASPAVAPSAAPSPTGEPRTYDGVKAAVDRIDTAQQALDGAALWNMLTATGQATMTQADYVKVVQGCSKLVTGETTLSVALESSGNTATVKVSSPQVPDGYTYSMVYEGGRWKHQPSDKAMEWMGLGAVKALKFLRDGGAC